MNGKLRLPVFIVLCVLLLSVLILIFVAVQKVTEIPTWSLFHPYVVLLMFSFGFIDRFGPERFNKRFYERLFSLPQRDKAIFGIGIAVFIFLGLAEPYVFNGLSSYQGIGLQLMNLLIWFGFTKLFGSQELNNFFWGIKT
jgi:hypothetical protein